MNWNLLSIAQKILSKKNMLENFQWYKKQHEKEIAAWRLGCSTILMLLEILWVFDKYLPQPCFPEWHENREIIQRDVKNIFPSIKNNFIIIIIIIAIGNSLSFWQISASWKKKWHKNRKSYRAVKCIFFTNPKIRYFQIEHSHFFCSLTMFIAKPGFFFNKNHSSLQFF